MTTIAPPAARRASPISFLLALRRDPLALLERLAREQGDLARLRVAGREVLLLSHPDLARELLVERHRDFAKGRALQRARRVLGDGLLTSEGAAHLRRRRMLQPAFHRERVAGYAATMAACAERAADGWRDGERLDVSHAMAALTLEVAGLTLFGARLTDEAARVSAALDDLMGMFGLLTLPFGERLLRLPIPAAGRLRRAERDLDAVIARLVAERLDTGDAGDMLSMLLYAGDASGEPLSPEQVRDEALTLLLAGHETTAAALGWAWHLLAEHPQAEARLHAELDALEGRPLGQADLPRLPYARAVLAEAIRLYPPAWVVGREALTPTRIGGADVPAGATVLVSPWVMQRDARFFADPLRFDPGRWLGEQASGGAAYMPFGAGPRKCIGESFAWMEGVLLLATLARRWRLRPAEGRAARPQPSVTLRVRGGLTMLAERRPGW